MNNENVNRINNQIQQSPFDYAEKVLAFYVNHSLSLSRTKQLSFGLRTESSFIDYTFLNNSQAYTNKRNYTNVLYNISYDWTSKGAWNCSLSFRKQIQRPNYTYLNPFKAISSDVVYFSGDTQIEPAKIYFVGLQTMKGRWIYIAQAGVIKDFISSFYTNNNNNITETYKNFENVYVTAIGAEYNNTFFKRLWTTKSDFFIQYFKLEDRQYNDVLQSSTPRVTIDTNNTLNFGKDYKLNINYSINFAFKDGLIKHHTTQNLDISLSKKVNKQFTLSVFANDILKTGYQWNDTTIPNYFYSSKAYYDVRAFGITLKWNSTGDRYQKREVEEPTDNSIERLNK